MAFTFSFDGKKKYQIFKNLLLTAAKKYANIVLVAGHGEVVELVYGTSLENWRAFVAYRGFESHPLRQNKS